MFVNIGNGLPNLQTPITRYSHQHYDLLAVM